MGFHKPPGIPNADAALWYILGYDRPGTNNRFVADGHSRKHCDTSPQPSSVSDADRADFLRINLESLNPLLRVLGMSGIVEEVAAACNQHIFPNADRPGNGQRTSMADKGSITNSELRWLGKDAPS